MKYKASEEEILAYYREHHHPYITLESAKKHWRYSVRWWHLAAAKERADEQERGDAERRLREKLWPSGKSTPVPAPRVIPRLRIAARYARGIAKRRPLFSSSITSERKQQG